MLTGSAQKQHTKMPDMFLGSCVNPVSGQRKRLWHMVSRRLTLKGLAIGAFVVCCRAVIGVNLREASVASVYPFSSC